MALLALAPPANALQCRFTAQLAPAGSSFPFGVTVDKSRRYIYSADRNNNRVLKMTASTGRVVAVWQKFGDGDTFHMPDGLATGPNGDIYVTDFLANRVLQFTPSGRFVKSYGGMTVPGLLGGEVTLISFHHGLAVGPDGDVYVTDVFHNKVFRFRPDGTVRTTFGSHGPGDGQFMGGPHDVKIDEQGFAYASDTQTGRIEKFDPQGNFVKSWMAIAGFHGISVSPYSPVVWVTDLLNQTMYGFTRDGTQVAHFGSAGTGPGQFQDPEYVADDGRGHLYITDTFNGRIQKFTCR